MPQEGGSGHSLDRLEDGKIDCVGGKELFLRWLAEASVTWRKREFTPANQLGLPCRQLVRMSRSMSIIFNVVWKSIKKASPQRDNI